tara:strand:+ start:117 stop:1553 length:1437 start_codon:yes stop_codon:yes gene_type:complete
MSKIEVDAIDKQSGSTLTLGGSGTAVTLACGATQSGFGRTGTVDWITTPKTSDFTAVSGEGYFVNSAGGAVIVTLPSSPAANSIVSVSDYVGSAGTNSITVARNGSNINGDASNYIITKQDSAVTFVFVDATAGWTSVNTSSVADNVNNFIAATISGACNTLVTCGSFKIATFKGPGNFTVTNAGNAGGSNKVDYLVVAGGASGGGGNNAGAGGGGGGGLRVSPGAETGCWTSSPLGASPAVALPVSVQAYPITVGGGGASVAAGCGNGPAGNNGNNSIFSTITSAGGGGGGGHCAVSKSGGSGGGGAGAGSTIPGPGGSGNTPPVTPPQGQNGGSGGSPASVNYPSGGGGGAGGAGTSRGPNSLPGGPGGLGIQVNIDGNNYYWSGGGGGPAWTGGGNGGDGGIGGGGAGGAGETGPGTPGSGGGSAINSGGPAPNGRQGGAGGTNSGGGGGGGNGGPGNSGAGGSGIVIIRYKFQE